MIGRTLGNFRIVDQAGVGGMATVYKAFDPNTDRYVAIKILPEYHAKDPEFTERFRREAKAVAMLEHPHIIPVFTYGEAEGITYLVMRYLDTGSLADRIKQGPLPLQEASRILNQLASALDYAHKQGVIHRDIKPSNVLLDKEGNAYLTDFGIAKIVDAAIDLTGSGMMVGTPQYMSPEQCRGEKNITSASDIYSLGIVLYEMLTGRSPFVAETPLAVIQMHLNEPLPLPRKLRPDLPEIIENIILKALAKDPAARYATCSDMASALTQAIAAQPAPAKISGDNQPTLKGELSSTHSAAEPATTHLATPKQKSRGRNVGIAALMLIVGAAILVLLTRQGNLLSVLIAPTVTISSTPSFTPTLTATPSPTYTFTPTLTSTATITSTSTVTSTPTLTATPSATYTFTPTLTSTATITSTSTVTSTPTLTPTSSPTYTFTPTVTQAPSITPTLSAFQFQQRGRQQANAGNYEAAINEYTRAIELNDTLPDVYFGRAIAYYNTQQLDAALADLTRVIELNPKYVNAYGWRGLVYNMQGKSEEAIADYTRAVEFNPNDEGAYLGRGDVYVRMGRTKEARFDYNRALEINPFYPPAYLGLGNLNYAQKRYPEALDNYRHYLELAENPLDYVKERVRVLEKQFGLPTATPTKSRWEN
jgi:serine/threonine protein kinase